MFVSSLTLLLAWEAAVANFDWIKPLLKMLAERPSSASSIHGNRNREAEQAQEAFEAIDKQAVKWVVRGLLLAFVLVHILQAALGVGLYIAAERKHKFFCKIWIGLSIPLLPFFMLRVLELLIVFSFIFEIDQEEKEADEAAKKAEKATEKKATVPLDNHQANEPVKHQLTLSTVSTPKPTPKTPRATTPSLYPSPPMYDYPGEDIAPKYNGFAGTGQSTNVYSTNNK
ncbi:unnamed protein product [Orchesella dallaii]|uniref:Transmembrane protein n=1 Tax=Orchesella dallaii TaxID=48710 RepID=A0ABP1PLM5_9HEXA